MVAERSIGQLVVRPKVAAAATAAAAAACAAGLALRLRLRPSHPSQVSRASRACSHTCKPRTHSHTSHAHTPRTQVTRASRTRKTHAQAPHLDQAVHPPRTAPRRRPPATGRRTPAPQAPQQPPAASARPLPRKPPSSSAAAAAAAAATPAAAATSAPTAAAAAVAAAAVVAAGDGNPHPHGLPEPQLARAQPHVSRGDLLVQRLVCDGDGGRAAERRALTWLSKSPSSYMTSYLRAGGGQGCS